MSGEDWKLREFEFEALGSDSQTKSALLQNRHEHLP